MNEDSGEPAVRKFYDSLTAHEPAGVELHCEPDRRLPVAPNEFVVLGHYRGDGWRAPFAHVLTTKDGKILSLRQITDTRCWPDLMAAS
ncbi:hypothetical protein [Kribbella sp. NPDC003557]|uniref:nuclear transport factor 2 family protein n=1 Tax=Kribbella sp. NPDC003557 TaxID=3154449 RepID=UPI0033A2D1DA